MCFVCESGHFRYFIHTNLTLLSDATDKVVTCCTAPELFSDSLLSCCSPVQLDDFDAYFKEMSKDSAYKFSLQFEVKVLKFNQMFFY